MGLWSCFLGTSQPLTAAITAPSTSCTSATRSSGSSGANPPPRSELCILTAMQDVMPVVHIESVSALWDESGEGDAASMRSSLDWFVANNGIYEPVGCTDNSIFEPSMGCDIIIGSNCRLKKGDSCSSAGGSPTVPAVPGMPHSDCHVIGNSSSNSTGNSSNDRFGSAREVPSSPCGAYDDNRGGGDCNAATSSSFFSGGGSSPFDSPKSEAAAAMLQPCGQLPVTFGAQTAIVRSVSGNSVTSCGGSDGGDGHVGVFGSSRAECPFIKKASQGVGHNSGRLALVPPVTRVPLPSSQAPLHLLCTAAGKGSAFAASPRSVSKCYHEPTAPAPPPPPVCASKLRQHALPPLPPPVRVLQYVSKPRQPEPPPTPPVGVMQYVGAGSYLSYHFATERLGRKARDKGIWAFPKSPRAGLMT